ncbi:MAG TPA: GNAT family N-acetyltransferase [Usitatibacter sp.]|nr:GNAT family N-acetyltransferase [Usitatibacter sp.]
MSAEARQVRHEPGAFFVEHEGRRIATLTYSESGRDAIVDHTWVDPAMRGGGDAKRMVEALVAWAREGHRKIVPVCSYVRAVIRGREYDDIRKA